MDTKTAISTSNSGRSETLSSLNEALAILKKYDMYRTQKTAIEETLEPASKTEPVAILEPNYEPMPEKPEVPVIPSQRSYTIQKALVVLAGVLLIAAQTILLKKGYLIPLEVFRIGFFSINAVTFVAVAIVVAGFITIAIVRKNEKKKHDDAVAEYGKVCQMYEESCEKINQLNTTLKENYEAEVERERLRVEKFNEEAQLEADKKNAEKKLRIQKLEGSMGLLQKKYMQKYSKVIPSKYANPDGIKAIIEAYSKSPSASIKEVIASLD